MLLSLFAVKEEGEAGHGDGADLVSGLSRRTAAARTRCEEIERGGFAWGIEVRLPVTGAALVEHELGSRQDVGFFDTDGLFCPRGAFRALGNGKTPFTPCSLKPKRRPGEIE